MRWVQDAAEPVPRLKVSSRYFFQAASFSGGVQVVSHVSDTLNCMSNTKDNPNVLAKLTQT
eukprot:4417290-Amphidinium_carterae.1